MISIKYLCPGCNGITEISNIENIKNSQEAYPLACQACGTAFSKAALVNFAKSKAEEMIIEALATLPKKPNK